MTTKSKSQKLASARNLRIVEADGARDEAADVTAVSSPSDVGALGQMTGYVLRRAQIAVFEDFIATIAETGLRPAQFSVLVMLDQTPGLTQSAVAAALGIQRANFVTLVNELERRGLATREASPTDKRSHALHLTAKGQATLKRARELHADHERRVRAALGDDPERFLALLQRLATGLKR